MKNTSTLSVIVPLGPGDEIHPVLLSQLNSKLIDELIIVFPDEIDEELARTYRSQISETSVEVIAAPRGRAFQMNEGACLSKASLLCFVHSDSYFEKLPWKLLTDFWAENSRSMITFFELQFFDTGDQPLWINQWGAQFRSRVFKMPFGDQALCLRRHDFLRLGAFRSTLAYGEDHDLVWRARAAGFDLHGFRERVRTSARKYIEKGWWRLTSDRLFKTYQQAIPFWLKQKATLSRPKPLKHASSVVGVFVKTPELSPVKTRLMKKSSKSFALKTYECLLNLTRFTCSKAMMENSDLECHWMVAEKDAVKHKRWMSFESHAQSEGGLGERLHHAYELCRERYDKVLFIGADSPNLISSDIDQALKALEVCDFVLQPSLDGGYVLFGGRKDLQKEDWLKVPYSSDRTFVRFKELLQSRGSFRELETRRDIDEIDDFQEYVEVLRSEPVFEAASLRYRLLEVAEDSKVTKIVTSQA